MFWSFYRVAPSRDGEISQDRLDMFFWWLGVQLTRRALYEKLASRRRKCKAGPRIFVLIVWHHHVEVLGPVMVLQCSLRPPLYWSCYLYCIFVCPSSCAPYISAGNFLVLESPSVCRKGEEECGRTTATGGKFVLYLSMRCRLGRLYVWDNRTSSC